MTYEDFLKLINEIFQPIFERDFWDYASIIAPFVVSCVAVFISLYSLHKQNKIALFDKRYKAFNILSFLMETARVIIKTEETKTKLILYKNMETYRSTMTPNNKAANGNDVSSFYAGLIFEAGKIEHLFKVKNVSKVVKFLLAFNDLISSTYTKTSYENEINQLRNMLLEIEKMNIIKTLIKQLNT